MEGHEKWPDAGLILNNCRVPVHPPIHYFLTQCNLLLPFFSGITFPPIQISGYARGKFTSPVNLFPSCSKSPDRPFGWGTTPSTFQWP
jgi:hypothetical protein